MEKNIILAFALTAFAGLATGIGSAMAFFSRRTNKSFLSVALGFSAGVMIYVSFVEIVSKARESLSASSTPSVGEWLTVISFFAGMLVIMIVDFLVPAPENPHSLHTVEEEADPDQKNRHLLRTGTFTALAIAIHNFPEGIATFAAALEDPALGWSIAVAVAIHNIPEGISVSVPVFFATGSKNKAFWLSFLSGLSEPLGAAVGYGLFRAFFSPKTFGFVFAGVAGIMVYISLDELLPAAREYGKSHLVIGGVIAGMAVMALSLLLFK